MIDYGFIGKHRNVLPSFLHDASAIWDLYWSPKSEKAIDIKYQNEMVQDYLDQCAGGKPTTWVQIDEECWALITQLSNTHNLTHREVLNRFVLPAVQEAINNLI